MHDLFIALTIAGLIWIAGTQQLALLGCRMALRMLLEGHIDALPAARSQLAA